MTKINSSLFNIPIVNSVIEYDCTDSTNTKAKEFAKRGSVHGTLFLAHKQTAGKGRMSRDFDSKKDKGIYMSLLLRPDIDKAQLANITLVAGIAVRRAISQICNLSPLIKWPNDIVVNNKKLGGILTEAGQDYVVVGIGLNVYNQDFPKSIETTATSIQKESGNIVNSFDLIYKTLEIFNELYNIFISQPDLDFLTDEYNQYLASKDKQVYIIPHNISQTTENPYCIDTSNLSPLLCKGIDRTGNLICEDEFGKTIPIFSGEVSLRGIENYT